MKSIIMLLITLGLIFGLYHVSDCLKYTFNPRYEMFKQEIRYSHKQIMEMGKIEPEVGKAYFRTKQQKVLVEGHYLYYTYTIIDTLPDVWTSTAN